MIPSLREIVLSVYAAARLARFDAQPLAYFDASPAGVFRSFFAAVVVAPFYALTLATRFTATADPVDPVRFALAEGIAYVLSWVAFPLMMVDIAQAVDRPGRLYLYICAYNWSLVVQNAIILPVAVLVTTGIIPPDIGQPLWLTAIAAITVYIWFIARSALEISSLMAVGVVVLDIIVSLIISAIAGRLY
ncbi:MAG: hypothetical protein KF815_09215 [Rhodospirillales bacterium]|nr:hypothetical protein [Rhodospirillales bacterium]